MNCYHTLETAQRILFALFVAAMIAGSLGSNLQGDAEASPYTSDITIESKFLARGFVPDGDVAKPEWNRAKWIQFGREFQGLADYAEAYTDVASLWTADHIYFAFQARYTTLNTFEGEDPAVERWKLWERDVVEVFLNPRPERVNTYFEFEVAPNNQWLDLDIDLDRKPFTNEAWNSGFEHATRVDETAKIWTCEFRIPLRSMNVSAIRPGKDWRLNFYRMDGREEGSKPRRLMSWVSIPPPHNGFHTPTRFGIIRFVK